MTELGHWIQHEASDRLNAELVKFLDVIESPESFPSNRPHPSISRRTPDTSLEAAIRAGDLAVAASLLRSGADANDRGSDGMTLLMIASGGGQAQMVELLLTAGADVHAVEPRMGASALHKAVQSGNADVVRFLLDHGSFIDQQSSVLGNTPLMDAVLHKHEDVVRLLLLRSAKTKLYNHWQQTALELARHDGLDVIARLIEKRAETDAEKVGALSLLRPIRTGDIGEVERLVMAGAPVNERVPIVGSLVDDYTPLGLAAHEGNADMVRVLLDAGADPRRVIGLMKGTPVHEAAYFGHAAVIKALTADCARAGTPAPELDAQGPYNGLTALHDAVWHGHMEAAQALVAAGARIDLRTHAGLTAKELAILYGYNAIADFLAEAELASFT